MDEIEAIKRRIKIKRSCFKSNENINKKHIYISGLITRVLVSLIMFLGIITVMNYNKNVKSFVNDKILKENISFSRITNLYNKYFGSVVPIKNEGIEAKKVFNDKIVYKSLEAYLDGYQLNVGDNYLVPLINSGIVVFVGEKEGYGKTVIVQGIDEVDYWYGNVDNLNVSLYDFVSKGNILGNTKDDKLYLVFQKKGEYLGYDEIME